MDGIGSSLLNHFYQEGQRITTNMSHPEFLAIKKKRQ